MPAFEATIWYGLVAQAKTPAIVDRLYMATSEFIEMPETRERLAKIGVQTALLGPDEFRDFIKALIQKWTNDAKQAGMERDE